MPKFSIVVPHFDGSISDAVLLRGIESLGRQTYRDFEVLLYHDGPPRRRLPMERLQEVCKNFAKIDVTPTRANDYGHSLRDRGIREAKGEYIVHFNADNVLYPFALEEIAAELAFDRSDISDATGTAPFRDNNHIVIFAVLMMGMHTDGRVVWRDKGWSNKPHPERRAMVMPGFPAGLGYIDCMQLVMRRQVWLDEGGWRDRSRTSDAKLYPGLVAKYGARYVSRVLGEHH